MKNNEVYQKVTDKILELIEQGTLPWQLTWTNGLPINAVSGKHYRGINVWLLQQSATVNGFTSNVWLTYKQVTELGGYLVKGSKASFVTYSNKIIKKNEVDGEEETNSFWLFKYYNVFNLCQTVGVKKTFDKVVKDNNQAIKEAEAIIDGYKDKPAILAGDNPYYVPSKDVVVVPTIDKFINSNEYYGALFHELVHSTGHEARLKRDIKNSFGDDKYSKEELIAEFGASYLNALTGNATDKVVSNSASYIDGWYKAIKKDPKILMQSASKAMQAVDYMQGIRYKD